MNKTASKTANFFKKLKSLKQKFEALIRFQVLNISIWRCPLPFLPFLTFKVVFFAMHPAKLGM